MKHHRTCHICEALCGLEIEHDGARVLSIRGHEEDVLSRGHICPKAVAIQDLHHDPDHLTRPVRRDGDRWVEVDWDEALDEVAARLVDIQRRHGRDAVATYLGNPSVHHYSTLFGALGLLETLGSRQRYSATSADQLPHMLAALQMFGHQLLLPIPDVDRTHRMVIIGGNPAVSNGSLMTAPDIKRRLKDIQRRGGRVVVIDPRRTRTAQLACEHDFIRPGSDALLLLALLHTLFDEGLIDAHGPWRSWSHGLERLEAVARRFPPERVAAATGIDAARVRQLAREHVAAPSAVFYGRLGVSTQRFGGLCAWLIYAINAVTGNLDRPGGVMFTRPAADIVEGTRWVGQGGHFDLWKSRVSGLPEFNNENPVSVLAEEIETPGPGQIRALITIAGNPVLSAPNGSRIASALDDLELMVAFDPCITATSRRAHFIFPPLPPLARDHYGIAFHALAVRDTSKYSPPMLPPPAGAHDDWETLLALAARVARGRGGLKGTMTATVLRLFARVGPPRWLDIMLRLGPHGALRGGRARLSLARLAQHPEGVDLGALQPRLPGRLATPDRRVALAPEIYIADVERLDAALDDGDAFDDETLRLIGRRDLRSNNSWLHNSPRLVRGKNRCTLLIHPSDAEARGVDDGARVRLASRTGQVEVVAHHDEGIMPGVVSLPHGWGHRAKGAQLSVANDTPGESINDVTDDAFFDVLTGNASFSGVPVSISPI